MKTKEQLLASKSFLDNEYLDKYLRLISQKALQERKKYSMQKHHIIPRAYYKYFNLKIDNSKENLVLLNYADHVLAHYYLTFCIIEPLKGKAATAFMLLTDMKVYNGEQDLMLDLPRLQEVYEVGKKYRAYTSSITQKGRSGNGIAGKIYINDGHICKCIFPEFLEEMELAGFKKGRITSDAARKRISERQKGKPKLKLRGKPKSDEHRSKIADANIGRIYIISPEGIGKSLHRDDTSLSEYLDAGWVLGRQPVSEDTRKKMSESAKLRGAVRKGFKESPELCLQKSLRAKGKIWINNGIHSKMIRPDEFDIYANLGYIKGRLSWKNHQEIIE